MTLGIETLGSVATPLIERNTTIPTAKSQVFSTAADNQPSVEIHVLQGERPMAADNKTLGRFILDGIMPAPRGVPQIEVTFDIDANGILNVKAKDRATSKEQHITITASTGLSKDEVERMKKEAESHAEEDKKKKEQIEIKNIADTLVYTTEKAVKEAGDKVDADIKKTVAEKVEALKKVSAQGGSASGGKDGDNIEAIKKATEELSQTAQKIGEAMYKQQQASSASSEQAKGEEKKAEEASYEEVKK